VAADFDYGHTSADGKEETMRRADSSRSRSEDVCGPKGTGNRSDDALDDVRIVEGRNRVQVLRGEADGAITLSDLLVNLANDVRSQVLPIIQITEEGSPHLLRPVVLEELLRICREAIVNAVNHAEASRIDVGIIYGRRFLEVGCHDNGRGIPRDVAKFASREGHWGLVGMKARATSIGAQLQIWSTEGKGTDVEIRLRAADAYVAQINTRVDKVVRFTLGKLRPSHPESKSRLPVRV
jgi:signal transduction histidine kinase